VSRRSTGCWVFAFTLFAAHHASAQDAGGSATAGASLSTDTGAGSQVTADANAKQADPGDESAYEPYEPGLPPEANVLELGVFGGIILPSPDHNLRYELHPQAGYRPGPLGGARLGYYPLTFLGIEAEGMAAGSKVENASYQGLLYALRGQLIVQAPTAYVQPFLAGGFGRLGAVSRPMGADLDWAWHFGLGAKVPFTHGLGLRVDLRDNLTAHQDKSGQAHTFEAMIGLSATIERTRREPPPPPADSDHDGFIDRDDKCPAEPGVAPSGCPADTDGDKVLDKDDYCPREAGPAPKGCPIIDLDPDKDEIPLPCDVCPNEPGVKPDGCPIRDTDGDGIFDDKDKCPKEPETKNGFEDADGCPDKIPDAVKKFSGVVQGIFFQRAKAVIRPESKRVLMNAVKVLQDYPSIMLEISGHTSSEGDPAVNEQLSRDRADAVKLWLVEQGIDASRLRTRGVGSDEPIADNKTPAGREKNRRIEFKVVQ
jgi:outer membrane protein OmpA-like peptidoglycan-associated protein